MKILRRPKGQTVIETALIITLLLMLFFGIAEIARAWWIKGQLNNAARVGVRVAIVTSPLTGGDINCASATDAVRAAACNSISSADVKNTAVVTVGSSGSLEEPQSGDEITVTVIGTFTSVVPGLSTGGNTGWGSLFPASKGLAGVSVMRHE
ncbi:MAG: pilus assembly protein [Nitrospiraceae bacterium]|nr:pilus assembly protein [Nitrospiraceae bacterium]